MMHRRSVPSQLLRRAVAWWFSYFDMNPVSALVAEVTLVFQTVGRPQGRPIKTAPR